MKTLAELRAELKKHLESGKAIVDKALGAEATDADVEALEKHSEQTARLKRQIAAIEKSQQDAADGALPLDTQAQSTVAAAVKHNLTATQKIGLTIKAMVHAKEHGISIEKALDDNGFGELAAERQKELVTTTPSKGGVTIPTNLSEEIIPILRPVSAYLQLDPQEINLPNGNLTIPRQDTGVSGGYTDEATDIIVEEPTLSSMTFSHKKLAVIVPISNELLRWSPVAMDQFVRGDMAAGMGQKMDLNLLRGDGSNGAPLGIVNKVGVYTFAANATVSIQNIEADLAKAETYMDLALIPDIRRKWVMSPRTKNYLGSLRDGNGNYVYPTLNEATPTLRGKPVLKTTQIPINLGGGTNASEVYLIESSEVWFAQPPGAGLEFAVSTEAAYKVSGVVYSSFQRDVTLIRGIMFHDTDIRRLAAVVKITGVLWQ